MCAGGLGGWLSVPVRAVWVLTVCLSVSVSETESESENASE